MAEKSLMEIWKSGARMPFIVGHPYCDYNVIITRYNWVCDHFEGYLLDHKLELSADWFHWFFVREA